MCFQVTNPTPEARTAPSLGHAAPSRSRVNVVVCRVADRNEATGRVELIVDIGEHTALLAEQAVLSQVRGLQEARGASGH